MLVSTRGRTARLLLAVVVVVATGFVGGTGPVLAVSDGDSVPTSQPAVAQVTTDDGGPATSNNTTELHRDPAAVEPVRASPELQAYLLARMSRTLNASAANLSEREYDRASELLDRRYDGDLRRYRTVAAELDEADSAETYERLGDTQGAVIADARTAERLGQRYADAARNGDDARARRLARRLINQSRSLATNTTRLVDTYGRAQNQTGTDYSAQIDRFELIEQRVTALSAQVRAREFNSTSLSVRTNRTTASFTAPVRVSGRLTLENATPVTNQTIALQVGPRQYTVETNATGGFSLLYRPVLAPVAQETLTVRYLPQPTALYLPARDSTPLAIRQEEATLSEVQTTETTRFREPLRVRGVVTVDGRRVAGVPLRLLVNETRLATTTVGPNGTFGARTTTPAGVPAGTRQLAVRAPAERAVRVDTTRSLEVAATQTTLTGSVARRNESRAVVTGQFTTADGRPLANRTLGVAVAGPIRTVETGANGTYTVRIDLTLGFLDTPRDRIRVRYRNPTTNLAQTSVVVSVPPPEAAPTSFEDLEEIDELGPVELLRAVLANEVVLATVTLAVSAGLVGGVVRLYRRRRDEAVADDETPDDGTTTDGSTDTPADDDAATTPHPYTAALDDARRALSREEPTTAVLQGYGVVWAVLREQLEMTTPTHRELYAAAADTDSCPGAPLGRLTDAYERTAYSPESVDRAVARDALEAAETVLTGLAPDALPSDVDPTTGSRPPGPTADSPPD